MDRRSLLKAVGLLPFIPWSEIAIPEEIKPTSIQEKTDLWAKYARYTDDDFKKCKILIYTNEGKWYCAPKIVKVMRFANRIDLQTSQEPVPFEAKLDEMLFVDKEGKSPNKRQQFDCTQWVYPEDHIMVTFHIQF